MGSSYPGYCWFILLLACYYFFSISRRRQQRAGKVLASQPQQLQVRVLQTSVCFSKSRLARHRGRCPDATARRPAAAQLVPAAWNALQQGRYRDPAAAWDSLREFMQHRYTSGLHEQMEGQRIRWMIVHIFIWTPAKKKMHCEVFSMTQSRL